MSSPLTEVALFPLKPGVSLEEPVLEIISLGTKHPGYRRGFWGRPVEDPQNLQMVIEWENYDAHMDFSRSGADYERCLEILGGITSGPPDAKHFQLDPKVLASPIVELATFILLSPKFEQEVEKFFSLLAKADGCLGVTHGYVFEQLGIDGGEKEKAYGAAIGWISIEAHTKALALREVSDSWDLVKGCAKSTETHHVKLRPFSS